MTAIIPAETFGDLLKFLRKRAHLTQRDLAAAVGYTEAHLSRLENNERLPDLTTVAALFIPALDLKDDPALMERLLKLAAQARDERAPAGIRIERVTVTHESDMELGALEDVPPSPAHYVKRAALVRRVKDALANERRVAICGMAGMGKTALAAEIARDHAVDAVFWHTLIPGATASVDAIARQLALFFWFQGQTQVQPILKPQFVPLPLDQKLTLLRAALNHQPSLLCFDDIHLLIEDKDAMAFLQSLCSSTPASLLLTSRVDISLPVTHIRLDGLDESQVRELTKSVGLDARSVSAQRLLAKTGGNPMLLRLAAGQLQQTGDNADAFIESLESQPEVSGFLVQAILRGLSKEAQWLANLVAVFRRPVDLHNETLTELCEDAGHSIRSETIEELQRRYLVENARRAALHPLVRDHLFNELPSKPTLRKSLHRIAARWFERASDDLLEAVHHAVHAGQVKQVTDLLTGRENFLFQRGQALEAADILSEALQSLQRSGRGAQDIDLRRWLHVMRGTLLTRSVHEAEAEEEYRAALALPSNAQVRASIISGLVEALVTRNKYAEALAVARDALQDLSATDSLLRAQLTVSIAMSQYNLGQYSESRQAAEDALALTRAFPFESAPWQTIEEIRARAHYWLANTARVRREPEDAMDHVQAALACARQSGMSRLENTLLGFMGGLLYDRGDIEESTQYRGQAMKMALELGDSYWAAYLMIHLCDNHIVRGDPKSALAGLDQARALLEQLGDDHGLADQASKRATILLMLGRANEAREIMERIVRDSQPRAGTRMFGYFLNNLAVIQLCCDPTDFEAAQSTLERALAHPAAQSDPMLRFQLHSTLAMTDLAADNPTRAQATLGASPIQQGLSMWVGLDRMLIAGFVALGNGQADEALRVAASVAESAGKYPLYRLRVERLREVVKDPRPAKFANWLWIVENKK